MKVSTKSMQVGATGLMIASALLGCNSEAQSYKKPVELEAITPQIESPVVELPEVESPEVEIPDIPKVEVTDPIIEPVVPIFTSEGINIHTQQPYSGTIVRGGDNYLLYDSGDIEFQDFELPEWKVEYKYLPMLEVLVSDGVETLCVRYSWKSGFGYAQKICNWSDTRQAIPLEDMQAAYYGYSVIETRVWVSGGVGLLIEIK
jgi:hypothetical protein